MATSYKWRLNWLEQEVSHFQWVTDITLRQWCVPAVVLLTKYHSDIFILR